MGDLELRNSPAHRQRLKEAVYEELNRACLNGHTEIREWSERILAHDLCAFSERFEDYHIEDIIEFCASWLNAEP